MTFNLVNAKEQFSKENHKMLLCLRDDSVAYNRAFSAYLRVTQKMEITIRYIQSQFVEEVKHLVPGVDHVIRILGIGSGTGIKDIVVIKEMRKLYPNNKIQIVVVDPGLENIKEYKTNVDQEEFHDMVEFVWKLETSQQFRADFDMKSERRFDLILAMESLYYEEELNTPLNFYNSILNEKGIIFITIGDSSCVWNQMQSAFKDRFQFDVSFGSDDVQTTLDALAHRYRVTRRIENFTEIDSIFDPESSEGSDLVDFISHVANFRQTAPTDLQRDFLEWLRGQDRRDHYRFLLDMAFVTFFVYKM